MNETNYSKDIAEERIVNQKIVWGFTKSTTVKTGKITHTHIHICAYAHICTHAHMCICRKQ